MVALSLFGNGGSLDTHMALPGGQKQNNHIRHNDHVGNDKGEENLDWRSVRRSLLSIFVSSRSYTFLSKLLNF